MCTACAYLQPSGGPVFDVGDDILSTAVAVAKQGEYSSGDQLQPPAAAAADVPGTDSNV